MLSVGKLIQMFVDVVSKNGNLLLDIGPKADGSIPDLQLTRLREFGRWMQINSEGIHDTRPWTRSEGKTIDGTPIRFTCKNDALYAILLDAPKSREITIESLRPKEGSQVQMLGAGGSLRWIPSGEDVRIALPSSLPGEYAYTLKISPQPS